MSGIRFGTRTLTLQNEVWDGLSVLKKITVVFSQDSVFIGLWKCRGKESFRRDWFSHIKYKSSTELLYSVVLIVNNTTKLRCTFKFC